MRSKSNFTFLYSIVAPFLIFALAAAFPGCKESPGKTVGLEFWGVFDDSDVYSPLIESFNKQYPNIKIRYTKKNYLDYEKDFPVRDLSRAQALIDACFRSEDYHEGRKAFAEKRKPRFKGK